MITSTIERVSAHPRKTLLFVALFLMVAGFVGGGVVGALSSQGFGTPGAESTRAVERIEAATGTSPGAGIVVLAELPNGLASGSGRLAQIKSTLDDVPGVASTSDPIPSADGQQALILGTIDAKADGEDVAKATTKVFAGQSDVTLGGPLIMGVQLGDQVGKDLGRAELIAMPILVVLSLLFFGLRGAILPVLVGASTVLTTFLVISGINQFYGMSIFALNLIMGLGLGLAIDYTLFLLTRFREELAEGASVQQAIRVTMRTSGRTVTYSAATVAAAMITLTVFPQGFVVSMGIAGAVVAIVAAISALVISPAIFALGGRKLATRAQRRAPIESAADQAVTGRWYRVSRAVMRRPGTVALLTAAIMLAVAAPAFRAVWTPIDASAVPDSLSSRTVSDAVAANFPSDSSTVMVVIETSSPAEATAYAASLADLAGVQPGADLPARLAKVGPSTWRLDVPVTGSASGDSAQQAVQEIRAVQAPVTALVGGPAADFIDQQEALGDRLPLALALLVTLTMLVLWLMTGSVILPVKAVIMNALTVGSALGVLTVIFQDGRLTGLLHYTPNGGIEPTDFVISAAVVFALSTDYGVFLLGRIKEVRDHGAGERESVAVGVQHTGSVVTAAAILLAVAVGVFSTSSVSFIQQIGVAVASGVLIDAFVVRTFLVPSLMALLGRWNWWSPMWLRRIHDRVGLSESSERGSTEGTTDRGSRPTVSV